MSNRIFRKKDCSYARKAMELMDSHKITYEDHVFESKEAEQAFKASQNVTTTPQIFFGDERIGGYSDLVERLGEKSDSDQTYRPVIALFSVAALMAFATGGGVMGFMGYGLSLLALLKLMDTQAFAEGFKKYDLVSKKVPLYAQVYPYLELVLGLCFLAKLLPVVTGSVAIAVGAAGGISIFKAVYLDKQDLNCACVGGNFKVPLGSISFLENAMMVVMGITLTVMG